MRCNATSFSSEDLPAIGRWQPTQRLLLLHRYTDSEVIAFDCCFRHFSVKEKAKQNQNVHVVVNLFFM